MEVHLCLKHFETQKATLFNSQCEGGLFVCVCNQSINDTDCLNKAAKYENTA